MVLGPAYTLVSTGSLEDCGQAYPMQVIRDSIDPSEFRQPYFYKYLGPVLYFAPFVYLFGKGTSIPFAIGQCISLLTFVGLTLWTFRKHNALQVNICILLCLLAVSIDGSIINAPTQLPFYTLLVLLWENRDRYKHQAWLIGGLLAAAYQFRPEALPLGLGLCFGSYFTSNNWLRYTRATCLLVFGFWFVNISCTTLRASLGATSASDHMLYVLGKDVLEDSWGILFGSSVHSFSELLEPDSIHAMSLKIALRAKTFLTDPRPDFFFIIILFFRMLWIQKRTKLQKNTMRDITIAVCFILTTIFLSFIGTNEPRYYDACLVMSMMITLEYWQTIKTQKSFNKAYAKTISVLVPIILVVIGTARSGYQHALWSRENNYRLLGNRLSEIIPSQYRMTSRKPEVWTWYAHGHHHVFHNNTYHLTPEVQKAYQPQALVVFRGANEEHDQQPETVNSLTFVETVKTPLTRSLVYLEHSPKHDTAKLP